MTNTTTSDLTEEKVNKLLKFFGAKDEDGLAKKLFDEALIIRCVCCGKICKSIVSCDGDPYCSRSCVKQVRNV